MVILPRSRRRWKPGPPAPKGRYDDYLEQLESGLRTVLRRRLISDRPLGLLLESGDCERFLQSGEIAVDPWTVLTPRQLPFVFGADPDARHE